MNRNIISCYYDPAGMHIDWEMELIAVWKRQWARRGWITNVLDSNTAKTHPLYDDMVKRADSTASVNDRFFHRACYVRWLAFEQFGYGAFADYDVFPTRELKANQNWKNVNGDLRGFPGFVYVQPDWHKKFIEILLSEPPTTCSFVNGQPNQFDMEIMAAHPEIFDSKEDLVRVVGSDGWTESPLVHFMHASVLNRARIVSWAIQLIGK